MNPYYNEKAAIQFLKYLTKDGVSNEKILAVQMRK